MSITPQLSTVGGIAIAHAQLLVLGGGVTGRSVAQVLSNMGAEVSIFDENESSSFEFARVTINELSNINWAAAVVSPGWRPSHPVIADLRNREIPLLNEIDLAWEIKQQVAPEQKWLAVTGTNGKTTTVELTESILKAAGINAFACGNVGTPVIDAVTSEQKYDYLILELSSFQLHWSESAEFVAGSILNIALDHIDWHGTFAEYAKSKLDLLNRSATAILNGDDAAVVEGSQHWQGRKVFYTLQTPKPGEIGLVEDLLVDRAFVADPMEAAMFCELNEVQPTAPHSVSNALAAAGLARAIGIDNEVIRSAIKKFRPGRHRIELVLEQNGIRWIDDSKATNPHAAQASVMSELSVVWIAGGLAKGAEMSELIAQVGSRLRAVVLIGTDRELIAQELQSNFPKVSIVRVDPKPGHDRSSSDNEFMNQIVTEAKHLAQSGDAVLLAPACASMDQFLSYGDRGDRFAKSVREIVGKNDNAR
jgi:UDP-N-acetylmuramoylalanine--D-glutamate ligase